MFASLSASNLCLAMESSVRRSTDVDDETLKGSFFGLGAASSGSGRRRDGGIKVTRRTKCHSRRTQNRPQGLGLFPAGLRRRRIGSTTTAASETMQTGSGMPVARQSALDRAKADAKAKKLRDEREAVSALEEFVKEFEAELSDEEHQKRSHHQREWRTGGTEGGMQHVSSAGSGARVTVASGGGRGAVRRHFTTAPPKVSPLPLGTVKLTLVGRVWIVFRGRQEEKFGYFFGRDQEVPCIPTTRENMTKRDCIKRPCNPRLTRTLLSF